MNDANRVRKAFEARVGRAPRLFSAPGRVNLIGEHTDYNDGFVLPMAIDRATFVAGLARNDRTIRIHALDLDAQAEVDLDHPGPQRRGSWIDYVEGIAQSLLARGVKLGGADLVLGSDVPRGAGLSSSAALEVAVGLALVRLSQAEVDPVALALAGQSAEHDWVGTKCGIMDQFIAALGRADHALLVDCRSLDRELVPMRARDIRILICDTGVKHDLATSAYNVRREQCERGVQLLRARLPDILALRDVSTADLDEHEDLLPEPVRRRCRHVVQENARTLATAHALRRDDFAAAGALWYASHRSLRDAYEVSCEELDLLVDMASELPGVSGARMTGGGFGGCTINLVREDAVADVTRALADGFTRRFRRTPDFFTSRACDGAKELAS